MEITNNQSYCTRILLLVTYYLPLLCYHTLFSHLSTVLFLSGIVPFNLLNLRMNVRIFFEGTPVSLSEASVILAGLTPLIYAPCLAKNHKVTFLN